MADAATNAHDPFTENTSGLIMAIEIDGTAVRALRLGRGWSQAHLAELTGLSSRTIQRLETLGSCSLETRSALAVVLEADVGAKHPGQTSADSEAIYVSPPPIDLSAASLFAYVNGHPRLLDLIYSIAARRRLSVRSIDSESAYLNEQVSALRVGTVRELAILVAKHAVIAERMSDYLRPEGAVDSGFILTLVLDVEAIETLGLSGFVEYREGLRYSSGGRWWAEEMYGYYTQLKQHS